MLGMEGPCKTGVPRSHDSRDSERCCDSRGNFWVLGSGYAERPALSNSEDPVNPAPGLCRPPNASLAPSPADNPVIGDPNAPVQVALFQLNLCSKNADRGEH